MQKDGFWKLDKFIQVFVSAVCNAMMPGLAKLWSPKGEFVDFSTAACSPSYQQDWSENNKYSMIKKHIYFYIKANSITQSKKHDTLGMQF